MDSIQDKVIHALTEVLGINATEITVNSNLRDDLRMDDLDYADLMEELEDQLDVDIADETFEQCTTVADVITYISGLDRQLEDA